MSVRGQRCFTTDPAPPILWLTKTSMSLFYRLSPKFPCRWTKAKQRELPAEPGAPPARHTAGPPSRARSGTPPTSTLHHCINPVARTPAGEEIQHLTD